MGCQPSILQVCVSCKTKQDLLAEDDATPSGQRLFDGVQAALSKCDGAEFVQLAAVECMNGCQSSCTAAVQAPGKYSFVIGNLSDDDSRIDDLIAFSRAHHEADTGLPAWRERPVHIRKNTLARLHPAPSIDPSSK